MFLHTQAHTHTPATAAASYIAQLQLDPNRHPGRPDCGDLLSEVKGGVKAQHHRAAIFGSRCWSGQLDPMLLDKGLIINIAILMTIKLAHKSDSLLMNQVFWAPLLFLKHQSAAGS